MYVAIRVLRYGSLRVNFKEKCTRPTSPVREHRKHKYVQMLVVDAVFCFVLLCFADPPSLDFSFPYDHTVTEGNNLTLQCKVTAANPTPNIKWYNVSATKMLISYKDNLTFELITRSHAGRYQCVVENGIGQPAVSRISTVDVQCKLIQIMLLRYWVSSLRFSDHFRPFCNCIN